MGNQLETLWGTPTHGLLSSDGGRTE